MEVAEALIFFELVVWAFGYGDGRAVARIVEVNESGERSKPNRSHTLIPDREIEAVASQGEVGPTRLR
ncbi:hypothetical protein PanWU01x14_240250 [Parasponia andersonii]|uniref:Uncharacterized protein n=1 Tax=Parasponia andersonii TaxID=3476 RepID=A0A2P5BGX0_PARAD|nr:hypothetical protein PanWU01x14_240250 [Parasponia andersonii]